MANTKQGKSALHKKIRRDLLDQLERDGTTGEHFINLVDDYMTLWDTKVLLTADIRERGVTVPYNHGGGQVGVKKNECVEQLLKVNAQMLKLLTALGLKHSTSFYFDEEM